MPESQPAIVSTPREKEWRLIFDRWKQSGLAARAFCERENISGNLFYYWKRRIRLRVEAAAKVKRPVKPTVRPVRFVPVHVTPAPCHFEVTLAGGRTVRVSSNFDDKALAGRLRMAPHSERITNYAIRSDCGHGRRAPCGSLFPAWERWD